MAHFYDILGLVCKYFYTHSSFHPHLSQIAVRSDKVDQAELNFSESIKLNDKDWAIWAHFAIPALYQKQWQFAIERLNVALSLCSRSQSLPLFMILAEIYKLNSDEQSAKAFAYKALAIDPNYAPAVKFMESFQRSVDAIRKQATELSLRGRHLEAARLLLDALKIQPESIPIRCQRCVSSLLRSFSSSPFYLVLHFFVLVVHWARQSKK